MLADPEPAATRNVNGLVEPTAPRALAVLIIVHVVDVESSSPCPELPLAALNMLASSTKKAIPKHLLLNLNKTDSKSKPLRRKRSSSRRTSSSSPLARNVVTLRECGCITERYKHRLTLSNRDEPAVRTTPCQGVFIQPRNTTSHATYDGVFAEHISDWSERFHEALMARLELLNTSLGGLHGSLRTENDSRKSTPLLVADFPVASRPKPIYLLQNRS
ncbi:hypothetical protein C8Q76DRAFT_795539 [Earliella scabrosa]|nr:hypothetical protein C8Q76DRAFT_795539 [Earliella scabrosa]